MGDAPRFRLRSGTPDWSKICGVDVDALLERGNAGAVLSDLVDDLSFSRVTAAELRKVGFDASEVMVRLLQLAVEYLLHVQNALGDEVADKERELKKAVEDSKRFDAEKRLADAKRKSSARQCVLPVSCVARSLARRSGQSVSQSVSQSVVCA